MLLSMLMNPSLQSRYVSSTTLVPMMQLLKLSPELLEMVVQGFIFVQSQLDRLSIFLKWPPMKNTLVKTCHSILPQLGYDSSRQGIKCDPAKVVLRQRFPANWTYVTGAIGRCIDHNIGSLDQLKLFELCILYDMVQSKDLDFAKFSFDRLVECISGNKHETYVPYPRWLALFLDHVGMGYNVNQGAPIFSPVPS